MVVLILTTSLPLIASANAAACGGLDQYAEDFYAGIDRDDYDYVGEVLDTPVQRIRASEWRTSADIFDDWATELEDIDVPLVARDFNEAFIVFLSTTSGFFMVMSTGNILLASAYSEQIDEAMVEVDAASAAGERKCGEAWPFGDGTEDSVL